MNPLRCILFLPLATALALAQPSSGLPNQPRALVASLYREVIARHPHGIPASADMEVFAPYLSQALLHRIDEAKTCSDDWDRTNPEPHLKAEMASRYRIFSGDYWEAEPQTFHIQKVRSRTGGSVLVYVDFTNGRDANRLNWRVATVLRREDNRFVVDDIIYINDSTYDNPRDKPADPQLSDYLSAGCDGPRWAGYSLPEEPAGFARSLYRQVLARAPSGIPTGVDWKIFAPYMSGIMLHRIDDFNSCVREWNRNHHDPDNPEKAPFGVFESGIFSGGDELTSPRGFRVERTQAQQDGSVRVYVKLAWWEWKNPALPRDKYGTYADNPWIWHVALVLVRENGRSVIEDVIYLKPGKGDSEYGQRDDEKNYRLSQELSSGCDGPHYIGVWAQEHRRKQSK